MTLCITIITTLSLLVSLSFANTDYDPNNSVNLNTLKQALNADSESSSFSNPTTYPVTADELTTKTLFQDNSHYDTNNAVQLNQANTYAAPQHNDSGPSLTLDGFLLEQEQLKSNQDSLTSQSSTTTEFNILDGVTSQAVSNQFIPQSFSSQSKQPSIKPAPPSFGDIDLNFDNADQFNQEESVDTLELKPFYIPNQTTD